MAPDVFHHLEGVIVGNEFRLYLYDNFTEPLDVRRFQSRVAMHNLEAAADGAYFRMPFQKPENVEFPEITAFIRFVEGGPEERFDFIFIPPPAPDVLPDFTIPDKPEDIFKEIIVRDGRIRSLISRGAWLELFVPALEAKDLALGLDEKVSTNSDVTLAIKKIVRGAWLLDLSGDQGNREKVEAAYTLFETGVNGLKKVYAR
jgi:hypothetical protein